MSIYPESPGFVAGSETSREAAESLTTKDILRNCLLDAFSRHYTIQMPFYNVADKFKGLGFERPYTIGLEIGLTGDEGLVYAHTVLGQDFDRGTIAARFTELKHEGLIVELDRRRPSLRGRSAAVHVLKRYAHDTGRKGVVRSGASPSPKQAALEELARMTLKIAEGKDDYGYATAAYDPLTTSRILNMARTAGLL